MEDFPIEALHSNDWILGQRYNQSTRIPARSIVLEPRLVPNARVVGIGDSLIQSLGSYTTTNSYQLANSIPDWGNAFAQGRCFFPPGWNKGVGGQGIASIAARFTTDLAPLGPQIIIADGGFNDTATLTGEQILTQWDSMIAQAAAMGALLIILPILPGTVQTGRAEVVRQFVNEQLLLRASTTVFILSITGYNPNIHAYAEALPPVGYRTHPNPLGAQLLGRRLGRLLASLVMLRDPTLRGDDTLNKLGAMGGMPGTGGTLTQGQLTSLTGQVATGWGVDGSNTGGGTCVASKIMRGDGTYMQQLVIGGSYSGTGKGLSLGGGASLAGLAAGDALELVYEAEAIGLNNIDCISLFAFTQTSGFAFIAQVAHMGVNAANQSGMVNPENFSGIFRTQPFNIGGATVPANMNISFGVGFRDNPSSSPVAGTVRIGRVSVRKLN